MTRINDSDSFRSARRSLGLSVNRCAEILRVGARNVMRWEDGERDIPGPAKALLELLLDCPAARGVYNIK